MNYQIGRRHKMAKTSLKERIVIEDDASIQDIMSVILDTYHKGKHQTISYARNFDFSNREGFKALWTDIKQTVRYKADEPGFEIVKGPSALYKIGKGDCKSFTIAACTTMFNGGAKNIMRLCHYGDPTKAHIYPIGFLDGQPIIMDSTIGHFDYEEPGKVWWMDFDPETKQVIAEVGINSPTRNQWIEWLKDFAMGWIGYNMLKTDDFVLQAAGVGVLWNVGKRTINRIQ